MPEVGIPAPEPAASVLVLGGPTATGKTELAIELAHAVGGAVVSADSRQVFRGLEIGTAQPYAAQRARVPHYLTGFLSPRTSYSAGQYGGDARRVLAALDRRGIPALLCGGSGLYLRAAIEGAPGDETCSSGRAGGCPSARLRERAHLAARWAAEAPGVMHAELARIDPCLAARVHPRDRQRVLRGLEFRAVHGRPLSATWRPAHETAGHAARAGRPAHHLRFRLEVPPRELERRIESRLHAMLERGLLGEARALFERYAADPPLSLNAVGYPELFAHFAGRLELQAALRRILLRTRQYAKRQRTWFRNQDEYVPIPADDHAAPTLLAAWRRRLA